MNPDTWIICFLTLLHPDITIVFLFYTININSTVYLKSYKNTYIPPNYSLSLHKTKVSSNNFLVYIPFMNKSCSFFTFA